MNAWDFIHYHDAFVNDYLLTLQRERKKFNGACYRNPPQPLNNSRRAYLNASDPAPSTPKD